MATDAAVSFQEEQRILWDLQQIVGELERIPGALEPHHDEEQEPPGPDASTTTSTTPATTCWSAHHRRALRRLDRVLEQLETNAVPTVNEIHSHTSSSRLQIQELLLVLLTRLEIPRIHNIHTNNSHSIIHEETTPALLLGQLVACILERIGAILWGGGGGGGNTNGTFWLLLPDNAVVALLRRLIQCRDCLLDHSHSNHHNPPFAWNAALLWLSVLNPQFCVLLEPQPQQSQPSNTIWQQPWFLVPTVAEFLRTALDMLTHNNNNNNNIPSWEDTNGEHVVTETRVQWRMLTGYLWTWLVRQHTFEQQQQQQHDTDVPRWLCQALHQAEPNLPDTVVAHTVQNILHTLWTYVSELTNHALDALDEAAVAFQSSSYNNHNNNDTDYNNDKEEATQQQRMEALSSAEYAVQDSLRQVALVMQLLHTLQPWCHDHPAAAAAAPTDRLAARWEALRQQQLVHLWVTVAPAFLEPSHVTTVLNYKQQQQQQNEQSWDEEEDKDHDLGYRLCHLRLQLAEMVLSSSSSLLSTANTMPQGNNSVTTTTTPTGHNTNNNNYETSLCLTFLRGLEYPELLGMADTLWHELERRMQESLHHRDLQQMLRAAVLTLRKQYLLPVVVVAGVVGPSDQEQQQQQQSRHPRRRAGAHAIVQRLLPLLWTTTTTTATTAKDPWDGFFWRQSAGLIANHHHSEGEGHE